MIKSYFFISFLFLTFLFSCDATSFSPFTEQDKLHVCPSHSCTQPLFLGLILLPNEKGCDDSLDYEEIEGVLAYRIELPGPVRILKKRLCPFIGKPIDRTLLLAIKKEVAAFYASYHHPLVRVNIPKQDVSSGVLQLVITESHLGKIEITGEKWFSKEQIAKYIHLKEEEVLLSNKLSQDLYSLNRNPFRHVDAIYTPGEKANTTNLEIRVKDRFPLRTYLGMDNTGNDVTGNNRVFIGMDWGKVFWTDQRLSYQFVSSSDFKRFSSHTLFYEAPLPWKDLIRVYGGYASVNADFIVPNITGTHFHTKGWSMQASVRYDLTLQPGDAFLHNVTFGSDFKRTNNNLQLGGRPVISEENVNLTQLMVGYQLGYQTDPFFLSFEIEGFYSPGQWVSDQSNSDYHSLRPFAKNIYAYTRSAFMLIWDFYKKWSLSKTLRFQLATGNLLPSEEYGIGGFSTVRGYKERLVNGDNAFVWNLELQTPPVSLFNPLAGYRKFHDVFRFLLFFDLGFEQVRKAVVGQRKTNTLVSLGPGIRYTITPYLSFKTDLGFQLHSVQDSSVDLGPHHRLHFSFVAGY